FPSQESAVRKEELDGDRVFVIHDFLTPQECARCMAASEAVGYGDAPLTTAFGPVLDKDVRNNERVMVDDPALAAAFCANAAPLVPTRLGSWEAVDFNERLPSTTTVWSLSARTVAFQIARVMMAPRGVKEEPEAAGGAADVLAVFVLIPYTVGSGVVY